MVGVWIGLHQHRCTVVGNPGDSLEFWPNSFEGGDTWGYQKIFWVTFFVFSCIFK
jgi:hypothetical protein